MLERTDAITNDVLEPITFVAVNGTVLCFRKWGNQRGPQELFLSLVEFRHVQRTVERQSCPCPHHRDV